MIRIVIIEDEPLAAQHLIQLIGRLRPEAEIVADLPTVKEAISWFDQSLAYDLIFADIQLADGICFDIFQVVNVQAPIIFTTAYDQYALRAFKEYSIDYLLKPIDRPELDKAFKKWSRLQEGARPEPALNPVQWKQFLQAIHPEYKNRFAVRIGDHLKLVPTGEVLFFQSIHKITYLYTDQGKKYPLQYSLQELEGMLDPSEFFRINRQVLLSARSIQDVATLSNSRLKVKIPFLKEAVTVSRERCPDFKEWLDR